MKDVDFEEYYERIIQELKKDNKRDNNYFHTLNMLVEVIISSNDFTELEKVAKLRNIVYSNGSLSKRKLKNIDKELGYEKYYEQNIR